MKSASTSVKARRHFIGNILAAWSEAAGLGISSGTNVRSDNPFRHIFVRNNKSATL